MRQRQGPGFSTGAKPGADLPPPLQGLAVLLLHCVFNREVRKHLKGVLAGKRPYPDDSATTRATLLTVGGSRGRQGLDQHQTQPLGLASPTKGGITDLSLERGIQPSLQPRERAELTGWGLSRSQPLFPPHRGQRGFCLEAAPVGAATGPLCRSRQGHGQGAARGLVVGTEPPSAPWWPLLGR